MRQLSRPVRSIRVNRFQKILAAAESLVRNGRGGHCGEVDSAAEYAEIAMRQQDWAEAVKRWRALLATHPEDAPAAVYSRLARAYRVSGDPAAAEGTLRDGLARYRSNVRLACEHAEIAMARRDWAEAVKRWRAIIDTEREHTPAAAYSRLARAYRMAGDPIAAEAAIREALVRDRDDLGLASEYAEIAMTRRDWAEAAARWQAILDTHGEKAPLAAYARMARAHRVAGENVAAETALQQGLARHRDDMALLVEYAEIAMARRDWTEAVKRWRSIIETHAENAPVSVYARLARAYRVAGDLAAAERAVREGLVRHRDDAGLAVEHAEIAMARRDWAEAATRWQAILDTHGEKLAATARKRLADAEGRRRAAGERAQIRPRPVSTGGAASWAVDVRQGWGEWVAHQSCKAGAEGRLDVLQDHSTPGVRRAIGPVDPAIGKVTFSAEIVAPQGARFMVGLWNKSLSEPLFVERPVTPKANGMIEVTLPALALAQPAWLILALTNPGAVRHLQFGRLDLRAASAPAAEVWKLRSGPAATVPACASWLAWPRSRPAPPRSKRSSNCCSTKWTPCTST